MASSTTYFCLLLLVVLVLLPSPTAAFGAGNIASLSVIEGKNWRHGDIEDILATIAFLRGKKWTSMQIKRTYFGNWLRDYSQAVDVGTLKGVQAETIRVLVWVLAFMSFGYATGEFEVTAERLGVYRPEEHIDNPKNYADDQDARVFDQRLRGPVMPQELEVDLNTGMKNYIANEYGNWATSSGYVKHSLARSIHFGRLYTSGNDRGREEDLCEALRCLGQALHCLEDWGAHTNYVELTLREQGYRNVFPHVGTACAVNVRGRQIFPIVTGTFGGVDFLHSVIGEASDKLTQSELDEVNNTLGNASSSNKRSSGPAGGGASALTDLLSKIPGTSALCDEAHRLQAAADQQAHANMSSSARGFGADNTYDNTYDNYSTSRAGPPQGPPPSFQAPPGSIGGPPGPNIPGTNMDPASIIPKIYPILAFRDKVVRAISSVISKIPGLEKLIDNITERVTLFVFGLLAPYIQPLIAAASKSLKEGSSTVVDASGKHQYEVWTDPHCNDPTHSLLSKDHFSNILNPPAGQVAAEILKYVAPRVVYAWEHPNVPVDQVLNDVTRVFHHPALRDQNCEVHRKMYEVVDRWARSKHKFNIDDILSSESVKAGKNDPQAHAHGSKPSSGAGGGGGGGGGGYSQAHSHSSSQHQQQTSNPLSTLTSSLQSALPFKVPSSFPGISGSGGGGATDFLSGRRDLEDPPGSPGFSPYNDPSFNPYPEHSSAASNYAPAPDAYGQSYNNPTYQYGQGQHGGGGYGQASTGYDQYQHPPPSQPSYGGGAYDQNQSYQQQQPQQGYGGYDQSQQYQPQPPAGQGYGSYEHTSQHEQYTNTYQTGYQSGYQDSQPSQPPPPESSGWGEGWGQGRGY